MIHWTIQQITEVPLGLTAEITRVWQGDASRNPFASPSYIELMIGLALNRGEVPVLGKGYDGTGVLSALWLMRLDRRQTLRFLPQYYCDYATAIYNNQVSLSDLQEGFVCLLKKIQPRSIVLNAIPEWGHTLNAVVQGTKKAGFHFTAFKYAVSPILKEDLSQEGTARFKKRLIRHRSLKNYANRLMREPGFVFETDQSQRNVDAWGEQFCSAHRSRWLDTRTPSKYSDADACSKLKAVLNAWAKDKILIRFSIFVPPSRITFVVGLRAENRIIHFHNARTTGFSKLSTGNITIYMIGLWMVENGFSVLDFGMGDEGYKLSFANEFDALWRVRAGRSKYSFYYLKGIIESYIREKQSRMRLWTRGKETLRMVRRFLAR